MAVKLRSGITEIVKTTKTNKRSRKNLDNLQQNPKKGVANETSTNASIRNAKKKYLRRHKENLIKAASRRERKTLTTTSIRLIICRKSGGVNMQDCSEAKKPCKGILKTSSSFDRPGASYRKSAKFDELNVLQTFHPADKDYGHMKIEEPKTPYNYANPDTEPVEGLDANLLAEKLRIAADIETPSFGDDNLSDEDFPETDEEKVRRLEFQKRRKAHYNEFEAVRLARKLIEEEHLDDDEESEDDGELGGEEAAEDIKSKTSGTNYEPEDEENPDEEQQTEVGTESASVSVSSANVRPMDIDNEDPSHPCAGRQQPL